MDTVASCISMKPEDHNALMAWRLVNWVRCLGEDLPQCFFQSLVSDERCFPDFAGFCSASNAKNSKLVRKVLKSQLLELRPTQTR